MVKIINNSKGEKVAEMRLYGNIGYDINGNDFANAIKSVGNSDVKIFRLKINSVGGNVFQAYSIIEELKALKDKGIKVVTECVGIAYSIAGVILVVGEERKIVDYGTVMIHDPFFTNARTELADNEKNMLAKVTSSLVTILTNNTKLDKEKVISYMSKETTFDSKESKRYGFVDSIIKTGKKLNNTAGSYDTMVACSNLYSEIKQKNMNKIIAVIGADANASEDVIVNAIKGIKNEKVVLVEKNTEMKNTISALQTEINELKEKDQKAKAETLVNDAIANGKINKEQKQVWIDNAVKDFDNAKLMIDSLVGSPLDINSQLEDTKGDDALAKEYEKILKNNPEMLDTLPQEKLEKMESAYLKGKKADIQVIN